MEEVTKQICIEDFNGRLCTKMPTIGVSSDDYNIDDYNDWGKIPYDIIMGVKSADTTNYIANSSLSGLTLYETYNYEELFTYLQDKLPIVHNNIDTENDVWVLRYKTMCRLFAFLNEYIRKSTYYRPCRIGDELLWVEISDEIWKLSPFDVNVDNFHNVYELSVAKFFSTGITDMQKELPEEVDETIDGICINERYDEFYNRFVNENGSTKQYYSNIFYHLVLAVKDHKYSIGEWKYLFSKPYADLHLCITADNVTINKFRPSVTTWIPNKRYYVNQKVWFDGDDEGREAGVYKLIHGGDDLYDVFPITKEVYLNMTVGSEEEEGTEYDTEIISGVTIYECKKYYYKGYFDENTRTTKFDDAENSHWLRCSSSVHYEGESEVGYVKLIGEGPSYIRDLQLKKLTYDNNGNKYDFCISQSGDTSMYTYLPYYFNCGVDGGYTLRYPILFYKTVDNLWHYKSFLGTENIIINTEDINEYLSASTESYIRFNYITNSLYHGGIFIESNNIEREEQYKIEYKKVAVPIDIPSGITHIDGNQKFYTYTPMSYDMEFNEMPSNNDILPEYYGKIIKYIGYSDTSYTNGALYYPKRTSETSSKYKWTAVQYDASGSTVPTELSHSDYNNVFKHIINDVSVEYLICYPEFGYYDIDYSTTYTFTNDGQMSPDGKVISHITRIDKDMEGITMEDADIFADEDSFSAVDIDEDIKVNIERGKSSAVEKHNVLGEINTFQDLLEYRNNYFNIEKNV